MKVGELVIAPTRHRPGVALSPDLTVGLVINNKIVRNRIGIMWSDGDGKIDYEPVKWLKIINESR